MDLLVAPDQMILQIHESIGHPLELDRILGDERNYAGTSFVTPDMFGSASSTALTLLNVTFDPTVDGQLASYGFDDEGTPATRQHLIENGILQRPLGGSTSQQRAGMAGVANTRACSWNRPPIDRMANLNVEPGDSTLDELIGGIEYGVFVHTNNSWSIDDSRNKFQFGCELGQVIRDGELAETVRNPNYRGISRNFWRSLTGVGDRSTHRSDGNTQLRQGGAQPDDRYRPRVAGLPVRRRRGVRSRPMIDADWFDARVNDCDLGTLQGDETLLASLHAEDDRLRPLQPRPGPSSRLGHPDRGRPRPDRRRPPCLGDRSADR